MSEPVTVTEKRCTKCGETKAALEAGEEADWQS